MGHKHRFDSAREVSGVPPIASVVCALHRGSTGQLLKSVPRVRDDLIGGFDIPGLPVKFSRWADRSEIAADLLGEHNDGILRELLSLTDAEIAGLYTDKILVRDPLLDACAAESGDGRPVV